MSRIPDLPGSKDNVAFLFDVGSPYAYLAAERVDAVIPATVVWQPVLLGGIFRATGLSSWARTPRRAEGVAEIERRAAERGLPPLSWPDPWPNDGLLAMRVAMVAAEQGLARDYALAALRLQFRDGIALDDPAAVGRAAEIAGLDPVAALESAHDAGTKLALREATDRAVSLGVTGVPSLIVPDGSVFWGDDRLDEAAAALGA